MRVALTGSIACGKSELVRLLREAGESLLDADDVVHELEGPEGEAVSGIVAAFGDGVLSPDGGIDRKKLAAMVFCGDDAATKRRRLEDILFPVVRARMRDFAGICVVPLLFETGWNSDFDVVACVSSREEVQIERMMKFRGYSREEALARIAAQMPLADKIARSDYVVENNGTLEELRAAAGRFLEYLAAVRSSAIVISRRI